MTVDVVMTNLDELICEIQDLLNEIVVESEMKGLPETSPVFTVLNKLYPSVENALNLLTSARKVALREIETFKDNSKARL